MSNKKQKLIFIDRWSRRKMGSSVMRVQQLSDHMRRFHGNDYDISICYVSKHTRHALALWLRLVHPGAILFFSKFASVVWSPDELEDLRTSMQLTLVDYVDSSASEIIRRGIDIHVACGCESTRLMAEYMDEEHRKGASIHGRVATVLHNYDVAIREGCAKGATTELSLAYLGSRRMTIVTPLVDDMVEFLNASSPAAFAQSVPRLDFFNAHYCLRKTMTEEVGRSANPFTKGITAAACGAVILINRDADDAIALLGEDYPFLTRDSSDAAIDDGLRHLKSAFGAPEWQRALQHLQSLHERTSHKAIAGQLHTAIRQNTA